MVVFLQARHYIYNCSRYTALVIVSFTCATSTVSVLFYTIIITRPDVFSSIMSEIQLFAYQRHAYSVLISFVILDLSSILVGWLLILGKCTFVLRNFTRSKVRPG